MPISSTPVMPAATALWIAARNLRSRTAALAAGMFASTSSCALSTSTPVGSPLASRMILPPGGSCVAFVMPADFNTEELTHTA